MLADIFPAHATCHAFSTSGSRAAGFDTCVTRTTRASGSGRHLVRPLSLEIGRDLDADLPRGKAKKSGAKRGKAWKNSRGYLGYCTAMDGEEAELNGRRGRKHGYISAAERAVKCIIFSPILLLFSVDSSAAGTRERRGENGSKTRSPTLSVQAKNTSPLYLRPLRSRAHPDSISLSLSLYFPILFRSLLRVSFHQLATPLLALSLVSVLPLRASSKPVALRL